jgi:hypothetical protein
MDGETWRLTIFQVKFWVTLSLPCRAVPMAWGNGIELFGIEFIHVI